MPDGRYRLGQFEVEVKDGRCLSNGSLAGSVLTMDRAVRNVMAFAGWTLASAVRLATRNPAQAAGIGGHTRKPRPGRVPPPCCLFAARGRVPTIHHRPATSTPYISPP